MNAYRSQASAHRPVFVLAAVVLTALSLALAVVIPAQHETAFAGVPAAVASKADTAEAIEVTISPERIEVVGRRTQETALDEAREAASGRKS